MGGTEYDDEKPMHEVYLDEYGVSRYQVTNQLYEAFDPAHRQRRNEYSDQDNQPVISVNWYEATIFVRWLGCQLPTEAQWEKAARGGKNFEYATKDGTLSKELANYDGNKTSVVGKYPPNPFGLYDLSGNVREWCQDWYAADYYGECQRQGIVQNPVGPLKGDGRVLRGGSFALLYLVDLRGSVRDWDVPVYRNGVRGLRVVRVA
jgi:iron(II)-dependent oxidoreductase